MLLWAGTDWDRYGLFGCRLRSWLPLSEGAGFSTDINLNHEEMNLLLENEKIRAIDGIVIHCYVLSESCNKNTHQLLIAAVKS